MPTILLAVVAANWLLTLALLIITGESDGAILRVPILAERLPRRAGAFPARASSALGMAVVST